MRVFDLSAVFILGNKNSVKKAQATTTGEMKESNHYWSGSEICVDQVWKSSAFQMTTKNLLLTRSTGFIVTW